jgi:hypothetical protein
MNSWNTWWLQSLSNDFYTWSSIAQRNTTKLKFLGCYGCKLALRTIVTYSAFLGLGAKLSRRPSFNIGFSSRLTTILRAPSNGTIQYWYFKWGPYFMSSRSNSLVFCSNGATHIRSHNFNYNFNILFVFNFITNTDICKNQIFFIGLNLFSLKNRTDLLHS